MTLFAIGCSECGTAIIGGRCECPSGPTWPLAEMPCSRCHRPIKDFDPPNKGMTAGYYVAEAWQKYANPGEVYICDSCMWADPRYIADYGVQRIEAMPNTPTDALLAEADALCAAASPAPWTTDPSGTDGVTLWSDMSYIGRLSDLRVAGDVLFIASARTLVPELAARVRELEAEARAVDEACLAVCPDNNPAVVGADAVIEDSGRYVCLTENGDPIIDTDSPAEVVAALDRLWGKTQERAETAEARVRELEAERLAEHENVTAVIDTLIRQRDEAQETVRLFTITYGEPGAVRDLAAANAELAALRAAKDEAERRMRNAEETNRVNESCLRNAMAEADALREERDEYRRQIMTASYDAASIGVTMIASDALAALREDRRRLRDALVEAHRELVELAEAKRYAGYGVIDRARAAIDAARKEET